MIVRRAFIMLVITTALSFPAAGEPDWTPLFNGRNLSGWVPVNVAPSTFTVRNNMIVSTGVPTGVMRTERMYENFILELDYRHMKKGGNAGVFVWADAITSQGVRGATADLVLAPSGPDMFSIDSGGSPTIARGFGDGPAVVKAWRFNCNWREARQSTEVANAWIPPSETDVLSDSIQVLSRDVVEEDFLRPLADSPLASQGAGKDDPLLPIYIGALPPTSATLWDWQKTFSARVGNLTAPSP